MTEERTCQGTTNGRPCRAPSTLVGESGFCRSHDPAQKDALRLDASKGGRKAARTKHLSNGELPPLESPQAAARWTEVVGRAVATGRLSASQGHAMLRAVSEFLRAHDAGDVAERMEALRNQVEKLKAGAP